MQWHGIGLGQNLEGHIYRTYICMYNEHAEKPKKVTQYNSDYKVENYLLYLIVIGQV